MFQKVKSTNQYWWNFPHTQTWVSILMLLVSKCFVFRGCPYTKKQYQLLGAIYLHCSLSLAALSFASTEGKYNFMCCTGCICRYHSSWSLYWFQLEIYYSQYYPESHSQRLQDGNCWPSFSNERWVNIMKICWCWIKDIINMQYMCISFF